MLAEWRRGIRLIHTLTGSDALPPPAARGGIRRTLPKLRGRQPEARHGYGLAEHASRSPGQAGGGIRRTPPTDRALARGIQVLNCGAHRNCIVPHRSHPGKHEHPMRQSLDVARESAIAEK